MIIPAALWLPGLFKGKTVSGPAAPVETMLSIATSPDGATVFLNGDSTGVAPLQVSTTAEGKIGIRFTKRDYLTLDTSVTIAKGRDTTFSFALQPAARVAITVDPADAEVSVGGKVFDSSRLASLQLPVGQSGIAISRQGYESLAETMVLAQGANPPLHFALKRTSGAAPAPEVGGLQIQSTPSGAAVMIAGVPRGKTPFFDDKIKPGSYTISASLEGYEDFSTTITIRPGKTTPVAARLSPLGRLTITSDPDGASVLLNGSSMGTTPYTDQQMRAGDHKIVLRKKGYEEYSTSVTVNPQQLSKVEAKLVVVLGQLSVLIKPFGSIYIDGRLMKKDTNVQYDTGIPVGSHQLRVVHPKFGTWEKTIEVEPNRRLDLPIDFNRIVSLTVTAFDESDKALAGEIYVDHQAQGVTPKQLRLRIGRHVIEVRRSGYVTDEQVINLDDNIEEPLRFTLKKR